MRQLIGVRWPGVFLRAIVLWAALGGNGVARAQQPFVLRTGTEVALGGVGLTLFGFGEWRAHQLRDAPPPVLDLGRIPAIDRVATRLWHPPAHQASNVLFGVALGASAMVAVLADGGVQPAVPLVILAESGLLCAGLTNTVKELVRRPRPYLYNPDAPPVPYPGNEDQVSFWSGHTANTAALTFACANMVQRSDASPGLKTATWIGAATLPAAMGYLRVRAGKHFPTDVLTGYAVGALVGWAVPYFHRAAVKGGN
jgi:membrane-associated phospholipid phosphatase